MNKTIFRRIFTVAMTVIFIIGSIGSHAYYLDAGIQGNEIINENFEDTEGSSDYFSKADSAYDVVAASEEGIPESSAHGNIVKLHLESSETANKDLETNIALIGNTDNIPEGDNLAAAKKVIFQMDVLLGSKLGTGYFDLRAQLVEKDSEGAYSQSKESNIFRIEYDDTALRDGTATSNAIQFCSFDWSETESKHKKYRAAEMTYGQWYTLTILFEEDESNPGKLHRSIWMNDELVVDKWQAYQSTKSLEKTIEYVNGMRISAKSVDADIYMDNLKMWTGGSVGEFTAYDGYKANSLSVSITENKASVAFDVVNYMDASRPVIALAAVYDKRTNTVGRVHYLPKVMTMSKSVSGVIENIELPQDYNESDYEIKFYIWNNQGIFAPVFMPELQ